MTADELVSALQRRVENLERDLLTLEMRFMTTSPSSSPDPTSGFDIQRSQFLNTFGIFVADLVLTNNSPSAGNVAWSPCRVIYQGNTFEIPAGNTSSGHAYITWTVNTLNFSENAGYIPGPTIFAIATNANGISDVVWPKFGSGLTQALLSPALVFDGPNGSLVINGVTFTDNSPVSGSVAWTACQATYQGTTYNIASGNTGVGSANIFWKLSSPNQFQIAANITLTNLGPDDFMIGGNIGSDITGNSGFFSRITSYSDHLGGRLFIGEGGLAAVNSGNKVVYSLIREGFNPADGRFAVGDGLGNNTIQLIGNQGTAVHPCGIINQIPVTFANLPSASIGDRAIITDGFAAVPAFTNTVTGGGTTIVPIYFDGAQWRYG